MATREGTSRRGHHVTPSEINWNYGGQQGLRPLRKRAVISPAAGGGAFEMSNSNVPVAPAIVQNSSLPFPTQIIQKYMVWAIIAGVVPLAFVDIAGLATVNYLMVSAIANYYNYDIQGQRLQDLISSTFAALIPNSFAVGAPGAVVRMIPVVGPIVGVFTQPAFAAAVTYAFGYIAASNIVVYGTITGGNPETLHEQIQEAVALQLNAFATNQAAA